MSEQNWSRVVLIVDAKELRRAGIVALVHEWASSAGLDILAVPPPVLGVGASTAEPKLVILSVGGSSLHGTDGLRWATEISACFPQTPCVVLSDRAEPEEAVAAARLGKQGFMPTSVDPTIALQALTFVLSGGTYFPREALLQAATLWRERSDSPQQQQDSGDHNEPLTKRQYEVLARLRLGKANKVIARDLDMQESTVKVHVRQIMRKLGAANRTQAALLAANLDQVRELVRDQAAPATAIGDPQLQAQLLTVEPGNLARA